MKNLIIFCFFNCQFDKEVERKVKSMCTIINELHGKEPNEILNKYGHTIQFPIDIVKIAKNIGIKLGSTNFSELEETDSVKKMIKRKGHILGFVRAKGEEVLIAYRDSFFVEPEEELLCDENEQIKPVRLSEVDIAEKLCRRQRFTIAHEIAHCCLHMNPNGDSINVEYRTEQIDYKDCEREIEANIFAGKLLIPLSILDKLCAFYENNLSISLFADIFKVSKNVMSERIKYLQKQGHLLNVSVKP